MTQADPSDDAQAAEEGALTRLEHKLCVLEAAVCELLLAEDPGPPAQPLGWTRRRHRQLVKFSVIAGGLSALLAGTYGLPPQNPMRVAVDYTVGALVEQMPASIPDVPDLGPVVIGNPDGSHQPLHPVAAVKAVLPDLPAPVPPPSPEPASSPPTAVEIPLVKSSERAVTPPAPPPPLAATANSTPDPTPAPVPVPIPASMPVPTSTPTPQPAAPTPAPPAIPQSQRQQQVPTPSLSASVSPTSDKHDGDKPRHQLP